MWDSIYINARLATCEQGYGLIDHGVLAQQDGKITFIADQRTIKAAAKLAKNVIDVKGRCITPGLIDCHTHLVYAGNRANEFEARLSGQTYADIAKLGGGILATVNATRAASQAALYKQSVKRAFNLLASGVTTLEIKSGYGLNWETEAKMLHVADQIGKVLPMTVCKTFLGAHMIAPEYQQQPDDYVNHLCEVMLPQVKQENLAEVIDVFCESMAFNLQQTEKIFKTASLLGLKIKCHAEQLSASGAASLAAKYHALSVDHLEYVSRAGIQALADSKTVAVLLPGAFYYLHEKKLPPIEELNRYHVPIAIASDCNPGTSPIESMPIVLNLACNLFGLTPEQALLGATHYAACALGLQDSLGTLTLHKQADFIIWDIEHPRELTYTLGANPVHQIIKAGQVINLDHLKDILSR